MRHWPPRRLWIPSLVVSVLALAAPGVESRSPQQATFRATTDVVAVDVQVIDSKGQPIPRLGRESFEVTINGRKRPVVSAELVQVARPGAVSGARPIGTGPMATNQWPDGMAPEVGTPRTFIVAIDAGSFEAGDSMNVVQAARGFIDRLQPQDRVGVFTFPPFGARLDPTTDRAAIRRSLDSVVGQSRSFSGQFNLSLSEIIDIAAETHRVGSPVAAAAPVNTGGRGVLAPVQTDSDVLTRVQLRECRAVVDLGCLEAIVSEASSMAYYLEERANDSLHGLRVLLDALRGYEGRKTVVLLSGGIAVSDRPTGRMNLGDGVGQLGAQAAHANATIYSLHVERALIQPIQAQSRRVRDFSSAGRERWLGSRLLDQFAGASGGTLLRVPVGSGEIALDRVLLETSAYYLLGVEPAPADRNGQAHRLEVRTNLRGATIRSRQWVVLPEPARN